MRSLREEEEEEEDVESAESLLSGALYSRQPENFHHIWHILHHQREACDLPQKSVTQPPYITVKHKKLNGQKDATYLSWSESNQQQRLRNIALFPSCHPQPGEHETLSFLNLLTARPRAAESSIRTIIHLQTLSVSSWLADAWADKHTVCTLEADQVKACSIFWHMLVFVQEGKRKCCSVVYMCMSLICVFISCEDLEGCVAHRFCWKPQLLRVHWSFHVFYAPLQQVLD